MIEAMVDYSTRIGASAGRGTYDESFRSGEIVRKARTGVARLINAEKPESIVFTGNCTEALNQAIVGLVSASRSVHVVCTAMDHNSVLRPMHELAARKLARLTVVPADSTGMIDPTDVRKAIEPDTALVATVHASNVTGGIQMIDEIGEIARERGALFLVDAAQSAGHLTIDVQKSPIDLLAAPGHKCLMGPLGTGLLYVRPGVEKQLTPLRTGGTGSASESLLQPTAMPDRFEAGSLNAIGLAGLAAGVGWISERTVAAIHQNELAINQYLIENTGSIHGLRIYGPKEPDRRVGVFSFNLDSYDPAELANILEIQFGILVRAGLHCAPLAHRSIGTFDRGGTVRASFGAINAVADAERLIDALRQLCA